MTNEETEQVPFYRLLRRRRRALEVTQATVGERMGVSQATISFWERGVCAPNEEHLKQWEEVLSELEKEFTRPV